MLTAIRQFFCLHEPPESHPDDDDNLTIRFAPVEVETAAQWVGYHCSKCGKLMNADRRVGSDGIWGEWTYI